jgi:hypothetical protein
MELCCPIFANMMYYCGKEDVYIEARLARLATEPGKQDEFVLCLYEKISSCLLEHFCYFGS